MPVRDEADVAAGVERAGDDAVGALADVLDRLAARCAVAPDLPAGALGADLLRAAALGLAVVPLAQVLVDDRVAQAGEPGGLLRAGERGHEHAREVEVAQPVG